MITAESILDRIKGAVFIFAFFKNAVHCNITDSPPKPHINPHTGKVNREMPSAEIVFNATVHSNNPTVNPQPKLRLLIRPENTLIISQKSEVFKSISIKR